MKIILENIKSCSLSEIRFSYPLVREIINDSIIICNLSNLIMKDAYCIYRVKMFHTKIHECIPDKSTCITCKHQINLNSISKKVDPVGE